jgi:VanZ family protein
LRLRANIRGIAYWTAAILYMALIFYLSSRPAPELAKEIPIIYKLKIVHIVEYGVLSTLLFFAARETTELSQTEAASFAVAMVLLYGATDELHQVFVPMRSASVADIIANCVGATMAQAGILGAAAVKGRR